jgi:hypothetical protein
MPRDRVVLTAAGGCARCVQTALRSRRNIFCRHRATRTSTRRTGLGRTLLRLEEAHRAWSLDVDGCGVRRPTRAVVVVNPNNPDRVVLKRSNWMPSRSTGGARSGHRDGLRGKFVPTRHGRPPCWLSASLEASQAACRGLGLPQLKLDGWCRRPTVHWPALERLG